MDSINSVFNQYVSGTANESSCDVRMSGQLGLGVHFAGYGRHNDRGAVLVSSIILNNKDRAIPFLFGADSPAQIGIV